MAVAVPEGEVFMTTPPAAESEAEGIPESEGLVLNTIANAVTKMVANANLTVVVTKSTKVWRGAPLHWPSALEAWGVAFPIHVYVAALLFLALAIWAFLHCIRVLLAHQMPGRVYYLALNFVISVCTPGRAVRLLIDPYSKDKLLTKWQTLPMGMFMFPSITAAFILVFATMLKVTKMQVVSPRLFSAKMIIFVVLLNYGIAATTDTLARAYANMAIMGLVCESYFTLWGIVASTAYFYVFRRLYIGTVINRRKLNQIGEPGSKPEASNGTGGNEKSAKKEQELTTKLPIGAKITLVAAASFLSVSLLHIWRLLTAIVSHLQEWERANHWQWYMYNTLLRMAELAMCGTILLVGSLPFLAKKKK